MAIFFTVLFSILLVWFWFNAMSARKLALFTSKKLCAQHGYQLLDETVEIKKISLKRSASGLLNFVREYHFDYSDVNGARSKSSFILMNNEVVETTLPLKNNVIQFPKIKN